MKTIICAAVKFLGVVIGFALLMWGFVAGAGSLAEWMNARGDVQTVVAWAMLIVVFGAIAFVLGVLAYAVWMVCYESCRGR